MKLTEKELKIVKEIQDKYGRLIDLTETPGVLVEILKGYGGLFDDGGGGTGGVDPGVSSITVGVVVTGEEIGVQFESIIRELMSVKSELARLATRTNTGLLVFVVGLVVTILVVYLLAIN